MQGENNDELKELLQFIFFHHLIRLKAKDDIFAAPKLF